MAVLLMSAFGAKADIRYNLGAHVSLTQLWDICFYGHGGAGYFSNKYT